MLDKVIILLCASSGRLLEFSQVVQSLNIPQYIKQYHRAHIQSVGPTIVLSLPSFSLRTQHDMYHLDGYQQRLIKEQRLFQPFSHCHCHVVKEKAHREFHEQSLVS